MPVGYLKIVQKNKETNEEVVVYDDYQQITRTGNLHLLRQFGNNTSNAYFYNFVLGDDVGDGVPEFPEEPGSLYVSADQNVVYEVPHADIEFTYPEDYTIQMYAEIDCSVVAPAEFPVEQEFSYTSITLRLFDGTTYSVERFPSIDVNIASTIEITWTVQFSS